MDHRACLDASKARCIVNHRIGWANCITRQVVYMGHRAGRAANKASWTVGHGGSRVNSKA